MIQQRHLRVEPDVLRESQPRLRDAPHVRRRHHEPAADLRATSPALALLPTPCTDGLWITSAMHSSPSCAMLVASSQGDLDHDGKKLA